MGASSVARRWMHSLHPAAAASGMGLTPCFIRRRRPRLRSPPGGARLHDAQESRIL